MKYCLPIIKNSKEKVLQEILQDKNNYNFYEVWLDYITDIDNTFIKNLKDKLGEKLIVVFRRQNPEMIKMSKDQRLKIISALKNSQSIIDLDISEQKDDLDYLKNEGLKINTIISYHNYLKTPEDRKLKEIIDTINLYNPTILKIATKCNNLKDALRLLELLLDIRGGNVKFIVLGMGELGVITRIFGTLWGNEMIFAPKNTTEASAPGQLTKEQLEKVFGALKG